MPLRHPLPGLAPHLPCSQHLRASGPPNAGLLAPPALRPTCCLPPCPCPITSSTLCLHLPLSALRARSGGPAVGGLGGLLQLSFLWRVPPTQTAALRGEARPRRYDFAQTG